MPDSANKSVELEQTAPSKDASAKVPVNKETMRQAARVFLYLLPYKRKFFTSLGFLLIASTLSLAFPYLIGKMLDGTQHGTGAGGIVINQVALTLIFGRPLRTARSSAVATVRRSAGTCQAPVTTATAPSVSLRAAAIARVPPTTNG